jgi:hypothetical protein
MGINTPPKIIKEHFPKEEWGKTRKDGKTWQRYTEHCALDL